MRTVMSDKMGLWHTTSSWVSEQVLRAIHSPYHTPCIHHTPPHIYAVSYTMHICIHCIIHPAYTICIHCIIHHIHTLYHTPHPPHMHTLYHTPHTTPFTMHHRRAARPLLSPMWPGRVELRVGGRAAQQTCPSQIPIPKIQE
eukprot:GHVO01069832.1.p1 GENE.GHVO01069832.1~~GHVO01069832.1.p1  ORF type:complete len:142 (-),score=20.38 GHVO01069832.1:62-487(-)